MSQNSEYPEHAPESFYDRLADHPWSPEDIPDAEEEVNGEAIYKRVRKMSADERREIAGSPRISRAAEEILHGEVYGVEFRGPVNVNFNKARHGRGLSEIRLSVSNSPHSGFGEDAHRAFRSFPFEAGAYREKYREMLQEYDENRKAERKIQETKNRVQNRINEIEEEIARRARSHPKVPEKRKDWAENHGEVRGMELADGARLSKIEPSERGRGVNLTAKRLDPEFAFILLSVLREGRSELVKLLSRVSKALGDAGYTSLREDLFEFLDTVDTDQ